MRSKLEHACHVSMVINALGALGFRAIDPWNHVLTITYRLTELIIQDECVWCMYVTICMEYRYSIV